VDASARQLANWKAVNVADGYKKVVVWKKDPETGEVKKHDAKVRKWGPGAAKAPPEPKDQPKQPRPGEGHDADIPSREFLEPPRTGSFTGGGGRFAPGPQREQAIDLANETPGRWESQDRAERYYAAYKNLDDQAKQVYEAYDYKQERDNYWEDPQRVARFYHALQNRPPGTDALPGVDKDNIEVAYKYMEFVNGDKPWWEWDALDYDDPGRDFLASIPEPPMETMFPHERNRRMMQQGTFAGGNVPEPQDNLELGGMSQEEYDNLTGLQKFYLGMTSNPAGHGAVVGGGMGLITGGPAGAAFGAGLGGGLGWLAGRTDKEGNLKHPKLADLFMKVDYLREGLERAMGVYGIYRETAKEDDMNAISAAKEIMDNWPAAWKAGHFYAETGLATLPPGPLQKLGTMIRDPVGAALGINQKAHEMAREMGPMDPIGFAMTVRGAYAETVQGIREGQSVAEIVDDFEKNVLKTHRWGYADGYYDPNRDWREGPTEHEVGLDAVMGIYEQLKRGDAPEDVLREWTIKTGASGQVNELMMGLMLDPIDFIPDAVTGATKGIADLTNNKALSLAASLSDGRPTRMLQNYGQNIRQGFKVADEIGDAAKYADDLTWTQRMLSGVTKEGGLRWLEQPVKDPGFLNRASGAAFSGGVGSVLGMGLFGGVGGIAGAAGATGLAAALTGFGAPAGILIGTLAGTMGWNKGITGMVGLTPAAKASQLVNNAQVNLALMMEHADNVPDEMVRMVKRLGQTDIEMARELGMNSLNAPEAAAIPMALRDYGKTADELIANWYAGETGRKVFDGIADALGRETKEVIAEVAQGKHVDTLFRQYLDEVAKASDESAQFILEAAEGGEFTPDVMKKWADGMVTGNMHMDADAFKADLYSSMLTHMSEWGAQWFGVEPDPAIIRFADTIKSAQSMALLGLNPSYFVNNVINNTVTAVAEGAFGIRTAGEIDDVWKRAGIEPPMRLGAGVGPEGGGGIDAAEVLDPIREATRTDGVLQSIKDKSKSASKKIGLFSNLSGKMEALASKQTYTAAFSQFMGRAWRRGTGFDRMPVALENALDAIDPNMKNLIYATIESGMSKAEIEDALWGGVTRRAVDNYVPRLAEAYGMNDADVGGMMHQSGVYEFLRGGLEGAESADDVMQVFDDLHEAVSGSLLDRQADNLENAVQHIRNKIELEGGQAAWRELSENVFMDEAMMRMSDYHEWEKIFSQREDLTHGQYQAKIERQIARQKARYKAMYNRHKATYLAIGESFGVDSDVARGLIDQLGQKQELWDGFYTQKWEDIRDFYRTYYDTPEQRWAAWDDLRKQHQELYAKTGSLETQVMQQMDEMFVRMVRDSDEFPTGADEIVRRGLEKARNIREEMKRDMLIFQDWLDKQEFSDPVARDQEWTTFLNETIRPQIQARMDESVTWVDDLEAFLREQGQKPEIEKAKEALAQEGESVEIPVMMTRAMRNDLMDLGYTIDETKQMTPQEAWDVINAGEPVRGKAGDVRDVASRYGIETATEEGRYKPGADQHILNIVRKWGTEGSQEVDSLDQLSPEIVEEAFVRRQQARDRQIRLEEAVHGVEEIAESRAAQEDIFADALGEPDIVEEALPPTRTQTLAKAYTGIDADETMTHQEFTKKHSVLKKPLDLILDDLAREAEMHADPPKSMKRFINEDFGGLSTELRADLTGETGGAIKGVPPGFFRESGRQLDYLLTALKEHGYVFEHATLDDVEAMLMAMLREGEDFYPRGYDPQGADWLHGIGGERAQRLIGQMKNGLENPVRKYPQRIKDEAFGRLLGLMDEPDVYPEGRAYLDIAISEDYWLDEMYKIEQQLSINPDDIDTPAQMIEDLASKMPPDASETITQRWLELAEDIYGRAAADETMVDEPTPGAVQADVAAMEQAEIEAMMNHYQDVVRQRSRADWLMDDWQATVDDPKALAPGDAREMFLEGALRIYNLDEEEAAAIMQLMDARARIWAQDNNSTAAAWWRSRIGGFAEGGSIDPRDLQQTVDSLELYGTKNPDSILLLDTRYRDGAQGQARVIGQFPDMETAKAADAQIPSRFAEYVTAGEYDQRTADLRYTNFGLGAKGAIQFLDDGRAIIRAMESPDVSTLAHEVGHIFRRDLQGDDLAIAAEWAGADDVNTWNVDAEEKFARGIERYLAEGKAPNAKLGKVFEQFKRWLLSVYRSITGSAIDVQLNEDIRGVFDRLLDDEAFNATKEGQFDMFGKGEDMPLFSGAAQRAQAETFTPKEQPKTDVMPGFEEAYRPEWEQPKGGAGEGEWFDTEQGPKRLLQVGQYDETDTPEFKRWFGDSKVIDKDGEPLPVFHGTGEEFEAFDISKYETVKRGDWGEGIYFTPSEWMAKQYGVDAMKELDPTARRLWQEYKDAAAELETTPMMAGIDLGRESPEYKALGEYEARWRSNLERIEKQPPVVVEAYLKIENPYNHTGTSMTDPYLADFVRSKGHDGIIVRSPDGFIEEIVVFEPEQIKSVNNRGTWDPNDPRILYQNADGTVETAPLEGETPRFVNGPFGLLDELEAEAPFDRISEEGWNEQIWPMMQTLEGMMLADDTIPTSLANTELDPNVAKMLRQYTHQVYGNLSDTKLAAVRHGEMRRDAALLNYNKRRGIDNVVTALLPYQFWYGRSAVQWAKRALDKPSWMANYARLKKMQRYPGHEEMPSRLRGKIRIPMPWLPDWLGDGLYIDPWHQLFPFEQLARPWDERQENLDMTERQAAYVIQDWMADGEISEAQAAEAMQMREGPLWEKAMTEGRIRVEGENANPFDFIQILSGYSLPLDMMAKILDGRPEDISRLPVTRMVEAATAYSTPGGINLEGPMRRALGWPERGKFGDYFVIRELANMVATGDMPLEVAQRAMVDKQGEAWTRALDRVGKYQATRYWGSALWTDFFPAGEERQRALHDVFVDALESDEPDALTNFFEEYPEFEARLQMRDWEDPQAMMRSFLVGQVWDQWMEADDLTRDRAKERFGETFQNAFLDKETRSYDAIDTETLAIWSRMLGGDDLDMAGPVDQLDPLVDAELAQAYKQYTQAMGEANPGNIEQLQALYFDTPENKRVEFLKRFPQLRQYWDWKNVYLNEHPELIDELGTSKIKDAPDNIQELYYEYQAARVQHFPNIYATQSQYFELPKPQRRAFLGQHPELRQYWDWRRAVLEEYPEMEPYLTSRDSMEELIGQDGDGGGGLWGIGTGIHRHLRPGQAVVKLGRSTSRSEWLSLREHGFRWDPELWAYVGPDSVGSREMLERFEGTFGSGTRSRKPPEPSFDLDGLAPALMRQLMGYYVNGQSLGAGARRALRQEWEAQGRPGGKFSEFVEETLRSEFR
jgi:hypothetical protein